MKLEKILSEEGPAISKMWLQSILETYPADSQRFFKKQKDRFANPVRYTISTEIENIYNHLLQGLDAQGIAPFLDNIIRVRAVQDFSPSQAVSFIFLLKKVIREKLATKIRENHLEEELTLFESRIDDLALLAFDIYMKYREKLYELRANDAQNQVSRLLKRAGLVCEIPPWEPVHKEGKTN
ncbi:MAG: RsbRD N-terminal domain-containing protein [Pseudomonadota bacterium]